MLYALNCNNPPSCLLLQFCKGQSNSKLLASRWSVASGLYLNGLTVIIADSSNHQAQTRLFDFFNLILHLFALPEPTKGSRITLSLSVNRRMTRSASISGNSHSCRPLR